MTKSIQLKDISLAWLAAASKDNKEPMWLTELRQLAFANYTALPFPGPKDDKWKRADLPALKFDAIEWSGSQSPAQKDWLTLSDAIRQRSDLLEDAWRKAVEGARRDKFLSLILAVSQNAAFLIVPKGQKISVTLNTQNQFQINFLFIEEDAEVTVWEHQEGSPSKSGFVGSCGLFYVGDNAQANFYTFQNWNPDTVHFHYQNLYQFTRSRLNSVAVQVGGRISHHETNIYLSGSGAENKVLGVLFGDKKQNFENFVTQNHTAKQTTSDIQYRMALDGASKSFFSGTVYISKDAQKSDAFQSAKALLLSKDARADAIPNLEILADDVRCSHGAAVGSVDEDQKYYLQTRGIRPLDAEKLVIQGFIEPVIEAVPSPEMQEKIHAFIEEKLKRS
jgi:Fe-S cluster assembly protein SufD